MKERDNSIDVIAGILLIHMVLGHVFQFAKLTDCRFYHWMDVLFFFMPWFFFKSGMFFNENKKVADVMILGGKKLMTNYIIWSVIGQILYFIERLQVDEFRLIPYVIGSIKSMIFQSALPGNFALWFLVTLYVVMILHVLLRKYLKCEILIGLYLIFVLSLFEYDVHRPVLIATVPSGLLFYALGEYLKKKQYDNFVFVISVICYLVTILRFPSLVDFRTMTLKDGCFYLWIPSALAGIILINNVFHKIPDLKFLSFIGKNSMSFYVIHWCLLLLAKMMNNIFEFSDQWNYFILLCISVVIGFSVNSCYLLSIKTNTIRTS